MNYSSMGETSRTSPQRPRSPATVSSTSTSMADPESTSQTAEDVRLQDCSSKPPPTSLAGHLAQLAQNAWRRIDPSLILENTGSVARDHLAAERTFLAYVRTSLAFASAGVALVQLFNIANSVGQGEHVRKYARPLGATVVVFGMYVLAVGTWRYFAMQSAMTTGKFPAARFTVAIQATFLLVLVSTIFGFLVSDV